MDCGLDHDDKSSLRTWYNTGKPGELERLEKLSFMLSIA